MRLLTMACAVLVGVGSAIAQQGDVAPAKPMAYEVVTIKPNNTGSGSSRFSVDESRLLTVNVSLKEMLQYAYDVKQDLISGLPGPLEGAKFDVVAKMSAPDEKAWGKMTRAERGALLRPVLAARFGLKAHVETKVQPVYELVIDKGGPKFKADVPNAHTGHMSTGNNRLIGTGISTQALARALADVVHRTVIDKTGLNGNFDIDLKWTPEGLQQGADDPPEIFTAVEEQLGLKLKAAKGPVQVLVVEAATLPTPD